jgi:hypothetical protein
LAKILKILAKIYIKEDRVIASQQRNPPTGCQEKVSESLGGSEIFEYLCTEED